MRALEIQLIRSHTVKRHVATRLKLPAADGLEPGAIKPNARRASLVERQRGVKMTRAEHEWAEERYRFQVELAFDARPTEPQRARLLAAPVAIAGKKLD